MIVDFDNLDRVEFWGIVHIHREGELETICRESVPNNCFTVCKDVTCEKCIDKLNERD